MVSANKSQEAINNYLVGNVREAIDSISVEEESNLVLEQNYYQTAKNIGKRLNVRSYDQLTEKISELGVGEIVVDLISEGEIRLQLFECFTCGNIEYIGKAICFFEAGIIAGTVSTILGYNVDAMETKCHGLGNDYCEFVVKKEREVEDNNSKNDFFKDKKNKNLDLINLTLHSLNLVKEYKKAEYRTEYFSKTNQRLSQTMEDIQEINEFNNTVLDSIPNCLVVIDSNGVIVRTNEKCNSIFCSKDIINKNIASLEWESKYREVLKNGQAAVWKKNDYIIIETPIKDSKDSAGVVRQLIPIQSDFVELLLDKIDYLEKEMKYYKNKSTQDNREELFSDMIIASDRMKETVSYVKKVSQTDATILLQGESGTGKSTFARKIHQESLRQERPFVYIDCTTIPDNFFEAELFGYEEGAFTGAKKEGKAGKLEKADGGTVFLDEISEIPIDKQSKLLRFLQEKKFDRIGGTEIKEVDVRIIAATNQNLEEMVKNNRFRRDLYYRLNVINIELPPLRQRWEDIPCLAQDIMKDLSRELKITPKKISEAGLKEMLDYSWPGNIRELENFLKRMAIVAEGEVIKKEDIIKELEQGQVLEVKNSTIDKEVQQEKKTGAIADIEEKLIRKNLEKYDSKTKAAAELGISRQTLYNKLKKYSIEA